MGKHVLVATDGSSTAQRALGWAVSVCGATGGELSVATAWQPEFSGMDPTAYAEHLAAARQRLEDDWCATLRATDVPHEAVLLEGDPRQVIPAWAAEHDAGLVVVGPHGQGHDHRHGGYLGSVTNFLAHNLHRPLASVPPSAQIQVPERIVVGVDGSAPSLQAIEWCVDYAPLFRAQVTAVFAELPFAEWKPRSDAKSWYQKARHSLDQWTAPLAATPVTLDTRIVEHEAPTALLEAANDGTTDLLVVGTRGRGGFADLVLGSTALKVLHRSDIPVVLVPVTS